MSKRKNSLARDLKKIIDWRDRILDRIHKNREKKARIIEKQRAAKRLKIKKVLISLFVILLLTTPASVVLAYMVSDFTSIHGFALSEILRMQWLIVMIVSTFTTLLVARAILNRWQLRKYEHRVLPIYLLVVLPLILYMLTPNSFLQHPFFLSFSMFHIIVHAGFIGAFTSESKKLDRLPRGSPHTP